MVSQAMHTWIATALGMLTVRAMFYWQKYKKIEDELDVLVLVLDFIGTLAVIAFMFYLTCC